MSERERDRLDGERDHEVYRREEGSSGFGSFAEDDPEVHESYRNRNQGLPEGDDFFRWSNEDRPGDGGATTPGSAAGEEEPPATR